MAAALSLLLGGNQQPYTIGFGIVCVLAEIFLAYAFYAGLLKYLTFSLFAYVAVAFAVPVMAATMLIATLIMLAASAGFFLL